MPSYILSTTSISPVGLAGGDNYYITNSGSVQLTTGTAAGISQSSDAESGIDIIIDGSVINLNGSPAINLSRATSTSLGGNTITIGASGQLLATMSFGESAIRMIGTANTVTNQGTITSSATGVLIEGSEAALFNYGSILANGTAIVLTSDSAVFFNSGHIRGINGAVIRGDNSSGQNSGRIEAAPFSNSSGLAASVYLTDFEQTDFSNSGEIIGFEIRAIGLNGLSATSVASIENAGLITSNIRAIDASGMSADSDVNMVNSGTVSGMADGIALFTANGFITNTATGIIQTTTGNAISANNDMALTNFGTIAASGVDGVAIRLNAGAGQTSITNHGTISAAYDNAIDASAILIGGPVFLFNYGTVSGNYSGSGFTDVINNFGTMDLISSGAGDDQLLNTGLLTIVLTGSGNDTVNNRGEIWGTVDLGTGNDVFNGRDGSVVEDGVLGGVGNDTLTGSAGDDSLRGGNDSDLLYGGFGDDSLYGDDGNEVLIGGQGADLLDGGAGTRDRVQYTDATAGLRADLQVALYNSGAALNDSYVGVEDLYGTFYGDTLLGNTSGNIIWGGAGNDLIDGRLGNDTLVGGDGNDTMIGGAGVDVFLFETALNGGNVDSVTGYTVADDAIQLENAIFAALTTPGALAGTAFTIGADATTAAHRIIYNNANGQLLYDADGTGAGAAILFATLTPGLGMGAGEFLVV